MKIRDAESLLPVALIAALLPRAALAADEIRTGKWEFTTQMQPPAMPPSATGTQPPAANQPMTRTACIDPTHPIPLDEQCRLDNMKHSGGQISWTMTCNSPQGPVPSSGSGHYAGDTMKGTLTARVLGPNGRPLTAPGRITGRFLGPCEAK
jgi:hypothetical protein